MHPNNFAAVAVALAWGSSAAIVKMPIWIRNTYAMVEISVGTPPINHLLLFDTGSGTSWIVNQPCANGACKNFSGYPRYGYDAATSSTSQDLGIYDSIDYLGGNTGGPAKTDMFRVAGTSWNQSFIAANMTSWANIPGDGFLGLAFSSIAQPRTETVVETMIQEGVLDKPKFAIYYGKEFLSTGDGPGEGTLTLGGSEEAKYVDGDMTWVPGRKDNDSTVYQLWRSTLREAWGTYEGSDGATVNSEPVQYEPGKANGVFDTGAGVIAVPKAAVDALYRGIGWPGFQAILKGDFIPLCSYFNASWSVTFSFSDDGIEYSNVTMRGDQMHSQPGFAGREDACEPPFQDSDSDGLFLLGQSFLRGFYSVFDFGATMVEDYNVRIGFGQLKKEFLN
ncbi:pepsinogen c protein [Rutstroemia sp. NJR-2017a BVV2]|nr:pepsinogen c protein [Rutstroemia sp. NJR-2017a BVV2]